LLNCDDVIERLGEFDEIVSWYGSARQEFRDFVASAGLPFRFLPALPGPGQHAVDFYNAQTGGRSGHPSIPCPEAARTFAVIHPFASSAAKRAPMERFEAIATRLGHEMPVAWLRGPEEMLPGAQCFEDLYDLACFLKGARIYVGNDSGIAHLAAAVGTPVLALFTGASDPRVWSPRGPAVWR
jgi:ADP-heptose:LPS heptosyltransferase